MNLNLYNQEGQNVGTVDVQDGIFDLVLNNDLVHQAVVAQMANSRKVIAHAKDRSEVRGGGKKPWRQKGTGRARHGSTRSPIWAGGGATFGPTKDRVFTKKINKKMKQKALFMSLSSKVKGEELMILDKITLKDIKTKEAQVIISNISNVLNKEKSKKKKTILLVFSSGLEKERRAFKNIPNVRPVSAKSLNTFSVLSNKYVVLMKDSISVIEGTYTRTTATTA